MIELFDGWWIDVDNQSYTLKRKVKGTSKKGEPIERDDTHGYYASLEGTLKALGKEIVRENSKDGSHTLTDALSIVSEARKTVEELIEGKARI